MKCECDTSIPYSKGEYNEIWEDPKSKKIYQVIRLSEGCPNKCPYCRESFENTKFKVYDLPEITMNNVRIIDMNLLCHKEALEIINDLGEIKVNGRVVYYELVCGIDYRYLTPEIAFALKQSRFKNIRIAWDWEFSRQKEIQKAIRELKKVGFGSRDIRVFIICNWKIPYEDNLKKLDSCKIWNVEVADCYFDNQVFKRGTMIKPIHWTYVDCKNFRSKCRKHNQLIIHGGVDPEYK